MTSSASEIRFYGLARDVITLDNSSQEINEPYRVWSFKSINGAANDKVVLPNPGAAVTKKEGGIWFLVINVNSLAVDFGIYDEGLTQIATVARDEAVYVSLVDIAGALTWVPSDAKTVTVGSAPATALTNLYLFHGQSGTTASPTNEKDAQRYNPLRQTYATVGTASSFDSLQEASADRAPGRVNVWILGTTGSFSTTNFLTYDSSTEAWLVSQPSGPSWLTAGKPAYSGADTTGGNDIVYEFGGVTEYGNFSVGSWTSMGTTTAIFQGTGISAYLSPDLFGLGTTTNFWYECVKLNTLGDVFVRLALSPSRDWTGSGGLIGPSGGERILGFGTNGTALYNPFLDTWTNANAYPGTNDKPGGSSIESTFYSFGGTLDPGGDEARSYSMITDSWTTEATMPSRRSNAQQSAVTA